MDCGSLWESAAGRFTSGCWRTEKRLRLGDVLHAVMRLRPIIRSRFLNFRFVSAIYYYYYYWLWRGIARDLLPNPLLSMPRDGLAHLCSKPLVAILTHHRYLYYHTWRTTCRASHCRARLDGFLVYCDLMLLSVGREYRLWPHWLAD